MFQMNRENKKYFYPAAAAIFGCCFLISCENNEKDLPSFRKKHFAPEEGKQIVSYYSQGAKVKAKLTAPYMLRNQSDSVYVEFSRSLHVDFYNDSMKVESQMDALYGKYFESLNKVFLKDSVVVKNILKGDTLHCRELWWDQKTEKFYTDKPIRINKKDGTILYGTGLEAPQDFSGYTVLQPTGPLALPENGLPK